jgi:hypothetical protein
MFQLLTARQSREVGQLLRDKARSLLRSAVPGGFGGWLTLLAGRRGGHPQSFLVEEPDPDRVIVIISITRVQL